MQEMKKRLSVSERRVPKMQRLPAGAASGQRLGQFRLVPNGAAGSLMGRA